MGARGSRLQGPRMRRKVPIGTNDLTRGVVSDEIVSNVREILLGIGSLSPACAIFVQSVMPRAASRREELLDLNSKAAATVWVRVAGTRFVDLWPVLATEEDADSMADYAPFRAQN